MGIFILGCIETRGGETHGQTIDSHEGGGLMHARYQHQRVSPLVELSPLQRAVMPWGRKYGVGGMIA